MSASNAWQHLADALRGYEDSMLDASDPSDKDTIDRMDAYALASLDVPVLGRVFTRDRYAYSGDPAETDAPEDSRGGRA